jgi:hypothetical protein
MATLVSLIIYRMQTIKKIYCLYLALAGIRKIFKVGKNKRFYCNSLAYNTGYIN